LAPAEGASPELNRQNRDAVLRGTYPSTDRPIEHGANQRSADDAGGPVAKFDPILQNRRAGASRTASVVYKLYNKQTNELCKVNDKRRRSRPSEAAVAQHRDSHPDVLTRFKPKRTFVFVCSRLTAAGAARRRRRARRHSVTSVFLHLTHDLVPEQLDNLTRFYFPLSFLRGEELKELQCPLNAI